MKLHPRQFSDVQPEGRYGQVHAGQKHGIDINPSGTLPTVIGSREAKLDLVGRDGRSSTLGKPLHRQLCPSTRLEHTQSWAALDHGLGARFF